MLSLSLSAVSGTAHAQDDATRASARELGYSGIKDFEAENYPAASDKLEKAFRLLPVPSLGLWSARALAKRGLLVEASERYREVTRLKPEGGDVAVQQAAQSEATSELNALTPRLPWITIEVQGVPPEGVSLKIDGVPLPPQQAGAPRPVNPGQRKIQGANAGERIEQVAVFAEGERKSVVLKFAASAVSAAPTPSAPEQPEAAPVPPAMTPGSPAPAFATETRSGPGRTLGFVALIGGGIGVVTGGIIGLVAMSTKSEIEDSDSCDGLKCNSEESSLVNNYNSMRTASSVSVFVGVGLAGLGGILLLTSSSGETRPAVSLAVGPASATIRGSF
jgi:hypothetical protein